MQTVLVPRDFLSSCSEFYRKSRAPLGGPVISFLACLGKHCQEGRPLFIKDLNLFVSLSRSLPGTATRGNSFVFPEDEKNHKDTKALRRMVSILVLLPLVALMAGCAQKIARPDAQPPREAYTIPVPPPAPPQPPSGEVTEQDLQVVQAELKPVYFDYDGFSLSPDAQATLRQNGEVLRRAPRITVVAEGHCDERGTAEYNLALGERRAAAVVEYLVGIGVPPKQLSTVSFGSELPVDSAHNDAAWAKNRRVHMRATR